jgi:hypothetical protein
MKIEIKLINRALLVLCLLMSQLILAQTNQSLTQTVCAGAMAEPYLINPPTAGSTYQWSLNGGGTLSGATTNSTTIDWGMTPGIYTVTVVETDLYGCEGTPVLVDVTVVALPSATIATSQTACLGGVIPDLFAIGLAPNWYTDVALTNNVFIGNSYPTGQTAVGLYTYYVTETLNGCEGPAVPVTLQIYSLPASPVASNAVACEGGVIPDLTATGTSVVWYSDASLTTLVGNGNNFSTGQTTAGVYTYYVTQNDGNGCESNASTVTLTINSFNNVPIAYNVSACFGTPVPDLTVTGVGVTFTWYDDVALTNIVGNNSPFATGQTAVGTYTYYVTESQNGCQSPPAIVILDIYAIPITTPIWHN